MIRDMIVLDAVVRPHNVAPENRHPAAHLQAAHAVEPDELAAFEGVRSVEVRQTLDDPWTPDRRGCAP